MRRFIHQSSQFRALVVGRHAAGSVQNPDRTLLWKEIPLQLIEHLRHRGIVCVDAENQFIIGIVLAAEAGQIFIRIRVQALDRFQIADRRAESSGPAREAFDGSIARRLYSAIRQ